jgi:hypothetical protein
MSAAASPKILPIDRFRRHRFFRSAAWEPAIFLVYALALGGFAIHLYRTPIYAMDSVQYMGNALLMEDNDIGRVHARVYSELKRTLPKSALDDLLGNRPDAPADQNRSRQARAADPGPFAEFLPMFAIRPLYNQTLWLVSKTGLGLVRSGILISVAAYFGLGLLLFSWIRKYAPVAIGAAFSLLLMISPPLMSLGRETTSDALATLVAFAALCLILEKRRLLPGLVLVLASIYFRTDFFVLAGLTILACWWKGSLDIRKAAILACLALGSVVAINHYSGDYGLKMLYYRNFISVPVAPGEMVPSFSLRDYMSAFRSGIRLMMESFFLPFLALGVIGVATQRARTLFAVTLPPRALSIANLANTDIDMPYSLCCTPFLEFCFLCEAWG